MKVSEYMGRRVRLLNTILTVGGHRFTAGEVMEVTGHWRGRLSLQDPDEPVLCVRQVDRSDVELLPTAEGDRRAQGSESVD